MTGKQPTIGVKFEADLSRFSNERAAAIRRGAMRGAIRFGTRAKLAFRGDIRKAGLGDRLANTWRVDIYPQGRLQSWHPAVYVHSKAPEIVRAHSDGATIRARNGAYLAIPTDNVPFRARRHMSMADVEARFGKLAIVRSTKNPGVLWVFAQAIRAKNNKTWRRATKRRSGQGRGVEKVLMFILIRQVTLRSVLTPPEAMAAQLSPVFHDYIAEEIVRELSLT